LLHDALRARRQTVTAVAAIPGISRKHLSNLLNGHAPLVEPLTHRRAEAVAVDPVLLGATITPGRAAPRQVGGG
jgi:hypothetical protein